MKAQAKRQALSYARFSSAKQRDNDSLRRQAIEAQRAADENGWELLEGIVAPAVSAKAGKNIEKLIEQLSLAPEGVIVIIEKMDRFSRLSPLKALNKFQEVIDSGTDIYVCQNRTLYTSDTLESKFDSLLMVLMQAFVAYEENQKRADRVKASWKGRQEAFLSNGKFNKASGYYGKVCYGYKMSKDGMPIEDKEQAKVVRLIFSLYIEGYNPQTIANKINEKGYSTVRGKRWSYAAIREVLQREQYTGITKINQYAKGDGEKVIETDKYYPAIIDKETFNKAEQVRKRRGKNVKQGKKLSGKGRNLLSEVGYCAKCGGYITATASDGIGTYLCSNAKLYKTCESKSRRAVFLEVALVNALSDYLNLDSLKAEIESSTDTKPLKKKETAQRGAIKALKKEIETAQDNFFKLASVPESLIKRLEEKQADLEQAEKALEKIQAQIEEKQAGFEGTLRVAADWWHNACCAVIYPNVPKEQWEPFFKEQDNETFKKAYDREEVRIRFRNMINQIVERVEVDFELFNITITLKTGKTLEVKNYYHGRNKLQHFYFGERTGKHIYITSYRLRQGEDKPLIKITKGGKILVMNSRYIEPEEYLSFTNWGREIDIEAFRAGKIAI